MNEKVLGKTGLKVKTLGFGGIPIQRVSEKEAIRVIRHCYDLGINFFDTARCYTVSEERVGKAMEDKRDDIIIATKSLGRTKEELFNDLETSLRELRTDWIDLYQLHNISNKETWQQVNSSNGALEAMYTALDDGRIRHLGITSHNTSLLTEIVKEQIFETVQVPFNYLATLPSKELLHISQKMKVGTIIMKPFGGGTFSSADAALKFILGNEKIDVVIPGMMSTAEVVENVSIASGPYILNSKDLELIERDRIELGNQFCRTCDYCQPCPQEINISFTLNVDTILKRMGCSSRFKELYQEVKEKVATCTECGECEAKCPYHLPIRKLLPVKVNSIEKDLNI